MNGGGGPAGDLAALRPHVCSFCGRGFPSLQSLGGHMTTHRRELVELRRQHEAFVADQRRPKMGPPCRRGITMVQLTPNHAFWEDYRKGSRPSPPVIDFMGLEHQQVQVSREVHGVDESEKALDD
ncbi:hypothetical protein ZIOFF_028694 [Zingiber officinale]|uniref:C2H2-type domain-containing protein n=1 Tax=Zingiber officinale TaxID=94328 RepID=A0A8J5GVF6_ZINOF|nr:hypothetical protein ZIOFF_028694 [Zingiber officinale]